MWHSNAAAGLRGKIIAIDVETTGLDPWHGAEVFWLGYCTDKGEKGYFDFRVEGARENALLFLQELYEDDQVVLVGHFFKFDMKMLWFEGLDPFKAKCKFRCTLIAAKVMNSLMPEYDLRWLSTYLLKRSTESKDEITDWISANKREFIRQHGRDPGFADAPAETIKKRNLWDVESTILLWKYLDRRVSKTSPTLHETEQELMLAVLDMELTGVEVDLTRARQLRNEAKRWVGILQQELDDLVCPLTFQKSKTRKRKGVKYKEIIDVTVDTFNVGSSTIQLPAAFRKMGIELVHKTQPKKKGKSGQKTGGGNWCFDEYAMIRYVSKPLAGIIRDSGEEGWSGKQFHDAIYAAVKEHKLPKRELLPPLIMKLRECKKMVSTYYNHIIREAVSVRKLPNGREVGVIHCHFNQAEAMTGRFSSSEPNLQNMPRKLGPRECFITRKSRINWYFDYEQVEMKFFVHFAKDDGMAQAVADDIHLFVAAEIYKVPAEEVTPERRKRAKGINFGIIYGAKPPKIAETLTRKGLPTTVLESSMLYNAYHRRFPSIRRTVNLLGEDLRRQGYVTNEFGRRYYLGERRAYVSLNYMCQGTSADLIKNRMLRVWKMLREGGHKAKMLMQVHDELCIEIPPSEQDELVPKIKVLMEDLTSYYVPITVGIENSRTRWSEKNEVSIIDAAERV